jgi:pyruvate dehydrogenase E1 component
MATDYTRAFANQLREFIPMPFSTLGTEGFGRSDTRDNLRIFFEVNRHYIVVSALKALADEGEIENKIVQQAIKDYGIDAEKPDPASV